MTALYIVSCVFDAFVIYLLFEDILGKRKSSVNKWILMLALLAQQFISSLILNKTQSVYARLIVMIVGTFLLTIFYETDLVKRFFAMAVFIVFSIIAEGIAEVLMVLLGITKGEEEEIIALFLVEIFLLLLVLFKKIFTKREGNIPIKYQVGFLIVEQQRHQVSKRFPNSNTCLDCDVVGTADSIKDLEGHILLALSRFQPVLVWSLVPEK